MFARAFKMAGQKIDSLFEAGKVPERVSRQQLLTIVMNGFIKLMPEELNGSFLDRKEFTDPNGWYLGVAMLGFQGSTYYPGTGYNSIVDPKQEEIISGFVNKYSSKEGEAELEGIVGNILSQIIGSAAVSQSGSSPVSAHTGSQWCAVDWRSATP